MLVNEDARGELRKNNIDEGDGKGDPQALGLLGRGRSPSCRMQRANGKRSGGGRGEDELLLEDVELAQGNGKEDGVEGRAEGEGEQTAKVSLGRGAQKTKSVLQGEEACQMVATGERRSSRRTMAGTAATKAEVRPAAPVAALWIVTFSRGPK